MSTVGYNGRDFEIHLDTGTGYTKIAAVQTKSATRGREAVDVTSDDDDGNRRLLPTPGNRTLDVSVEGVVTSTNFGDLQDLYNSDEFADIKIVNADGSAETAEDGFFVTSFERSGEQDGHVAFTMEIQSSGPITITPAS